jgi:hypothetical protein
MEQKLLVRSVVLHGRIAAEGVANGAKYTDARGGLVGKRAFFRARSCLDANTDARYHETKAAFVISLERNLAWM